MNIVGRVLWRLFAALILTAPLSLAAPAPAISGTNVGAPTTVAVPETTRLDQEGSGSLLPKELSPKDLSPWGMFSAAHVVVKAVMIGLALASLVTWTIALAKGWELFAAKRRLAAQNQLLAPVRTLAEAGRVLAGQAQLEAAARAVSSVVSAPVSTIMVSLPSVLSSNST